MTNFAQNDYQCLLVGKTGAGLKDAATLNALALGEIGIFTPAGVKLTEAAAATTDRFILAVGRGTGITPLKTPVIDKNKVTGQGIKVTVAATEQVDYIGYNGTTGSIELNNSTVYRVSLSIKEAITSNHGGTYIKDMVYKSDASATQGEIAAGLVASGIANFSREAEKGIKFERVCSHAGAAMGAAADTVVGALGSKYVTVTDTGADTSVIALSAGDYFRAGTAVTDPVYLIAASTVTTGGGVLTLDVPLQTAVNLVGTTAEYITAAQAGASDFGIKLSGQELGFTVGRIGYRKMRWITMLGADAFGATLLTNSVAATPGSGVYEQIAELEHFLAGNNGEIFRTGEPTTYPLVSLVEDVAYDLLTINFYDGRTDSLGYVNSPKVVTLAIPNSTPGFALTGTTDDITDVLEVLLGLSGGAWAL